MGDEELSKHNKIETGNAIAVQKTERASKITIKNKMAQVGSCIRPRIRDEKAQADYWKDCITQKP